MQAYEKNRKKAILIGVLGGLLCLVIIGLLAARVLIWSKDRQETRLLVLVNDWNSMDSADFKVKLKKLSCGIELDTRCAADFEQMLSDCCIAGCDPVVLDGYRSRDEQDRLYNNEYRQYISQGKTPQEAMALTVRKVPRPGRSEHELGLSVDIADGKYRELDEKQAETDTVKWLMENSWRYGFVLRYPEGTEGITGMIYQPWHYRYVGKKAAEQMNELDICLEEYLQMFFPENAVIVHRK